VSGRRGLETAGSTTTPASGTLRGESQPCHDWHACEEPWSRFNVEWPKPEFTRGQVHAVPSVSGIGSLLTRYHLTGSRFSAATI
jgi:hypothetical protein